MVVRPSYYRPPDDDRFPPEVLIVPVRCPMVGACLGGTTPGQLSCAVGHSGVLCGRCAPGQYRTYTGCMLCPQTFEQANTWAYVLVSIFGAGAYGDRATDLKQSLGLT